MPVGFQSTNDAGAFQIDSELRALTIRNKGNVTSGFFEPGTSTSYASIPVSADSIIAFRAPGLKVAPVAQWLGSLRLAVYGAQLANIAYWEFGPHISGGQNVGMQLFDASGNLNYETSRGTFNYVITQVGTGSLGLAGGRTYAVIPTVLFAGMRRYMETTGGGVGDYFLIAIVSTDMAQLDSSSLTVTREEYHAYVNGPFSSATPVPIGWGDDFNNGQTTQYIVVDVTNL